MKPTGPAARAFRFVPRGPPSSPPSAQDRPDHPLTEEAVQESCRKAVTHLGHILGKMSNLGKMFNLFQISV